MDAEACECVYVSACKCMPECVFLSSSMRLCTYPAKKMRLNYNCICLCVCLYMNEIISGFITKIYIGFVHKFLYVLYNNV